jgi:probable rRNA maturation factor
MTNEKIAEKTVKDYLVEKSLNPNAKVSVFFVCQTKIRKLNKKYRQIDESTDVLSFPIWENLKDIPKSGEVALGDIFICLDNMGDHSLEFLIRHSLDHLIGKHH